MTDRLRWILKGSHCRARVRLCVDFMCPLVPVEPPESPKSPPVHLPEYE